MNDEIKALQRGIEYVTKVETERDEAIAALGVERRRNLDLTEDLIKTRRESDHWMRVSVAISSKLTAIQSVISDAIAYAQEEAGIKGRTDQ